MQIGEFEILTAAFKTSVQSSFRTDDEVIRNEELNHLQGGGGKLLEEKRRHTRKALFMGVHYTTEGRGHSDFIQNISTGGAFIQTRVPFPIGQMISMVFPLPSYRIPVHITGEVVRTSPQGIGLKFKLMRPMKAAPAMGQLSVDGEHFFGTTGKVKIIPKARKKRVRWNASADPGVIGYKLYWAAGENVSYDSNCIEVGYLPELILPDDLPSFPLVAGELQLGLTALNYLGNESDMTKFTVSFDFTAQSIQ